MKTENLSMKMNSSVFSMSMAFWNEQIKSSSLTSRNVLDSKSKYSPVKYAPKTIRPRPISNDLREEKYVENCSFKSLDESAIKSTSTQPKEYKPIRLEGKLEISLADSVLQCVQTSKQQNKISRTEEDKTKLENKVHFQEIKIDILTLKINELLSLNARRQQGDSVEGLKHTSIRKEPENEVCNAPASNDTVCTFSECVCRLIESKDVAAPLADDSKTTKRTANCSVQTSSDSIISIKYNDRIPSLTSKCKGNERSHKDSRNNFLKHGSDKYCDYLNSHVDPVMKMKRKLNEISKHFSSKNCTCIHRS